MPSMSLSHARAPLASAAAVCPARLRGRRSPRLLHPRAQELSLTQSAVSRHVRTLEETFGCRLFERAGRQLGADEPGKLLLPGLSEGFEALARACGNLAVAEGTLRLKAPTTLSLRWLLARLARFRQLSPQLDIQSPASGGQRPGRLRP